MASRLALSRHSATALRSLSRPAPVFARGYASAGVGGASNLSQSAQSNINVSLFFRVSIRSISGH